jgi:hypothetical protein
MLQPRGNRIILAAIALTMSSLACAGSDANEIQKNVAAQRNFNAIQYVYQHGVPHTDGNGAPRSTYEAGNSKSFTLTYEPFDAHVVRITR